MELQSTMKTGETRQPASLLMSSLLFVVSVGTLAA